LNCRRFGRTGHQSTLAIFGAAAFYEIRQKQADQTMECVIKAGINHIDVAPSYGQAERRLAPWIKRERSRFFLGCKTMERTRKGAYDELRRSLDTLQTDSFDLYQFHSVNQMSDLDLITAAGGALEGVLAARQEGLLRFIGITGHGLSVPEVFLEALRRFDFDSVLFPLNFILYTNPKYRAVSEQLLAQCATRDIGSMAIKSIARGTWGKSKKINTTWYQPFTEWEWIQRAVHFTLSQPVTGICTAADVSILPAILEACGSFKTPSVEQNDELLHHAEEFESIFVEGM
jgi:aryl-alcohol dehydrogenase-like predicted oxidoreductase